MRHEIWQETIQANRQKQQQLRRTQIITLLLSAMMILITLLPSSRICLQASSLHYHCPIRMVFMYQFLHANIFHCLANIWCLLIMLYAWNITLRRLLIAYLISVIFGIVIMNTPNLQSIVGFSGVTYALAGLYSITNNRKRDKRYILTILVTILLTAFIPRMSVLTHLSCYLIALSIMISGEYKNRNNHEQNQINH